MLLAPLVLVPMGVEVLRRSAFFAASKTLGALVQWQLPAALLFAVAFLLPGGWLAVMLALPWVVVTFVLAWVGAQHLLKAGRRSASEFSLSMGLVYIAVAGIWAVFERAGIFPFGFNPEIVFLTIVHFHYAGFLLPVLAGLATERLSGIFAPITCHFTVGSVALLAVGITLTQFGIDTDWETVSAWLMALSGTAVAGMHWRLAFQKGNPSMVRTLWALAALMLVGGMLLAGLYGTRFMAPVAWLDIPMMRALHGTLNAVGFSGCAVLGWFIEGERVSG